MTTTASDVEDGPAVRDELARASVERLVGLQQANGAFVASPDFGEYQYCWLRDGSFVAFALDRVEMHEPAARYHAWVLEVLGTEHGIGKLLEDATARQRAGVHAEPDEMPPARFTLDGGVVVDDWPNFQIDGYGIWLWALEEHLERTGASLDGVTARTVLRVGEYLDALAFVPCWSVWEEDGGSVHTSTLAAVYAGLRAASRLLGEPRFAKRAEEVGERIVRTRDEGHLQKSSASTEVDASSLWCSVPFAVLDPYDPTSIATAEAVEEQLLLEGGVRRYPSDTYFGGGAWPVLSASLGWYYARAGDLARAEVNRAWIAARFAGGRLAEQFGGEKHDPAGYQMWVERWGTPAADLLWSHAMYVVLCAEIEERSES